MKSEFVKLMNRLKEIAYLDRADTDEENYRYSFFRDRKGEKRITFLYLDAYPIILVCDTDHNVFYLTEIKIDSEQFENPCVVLIKLSVNNFTVAVVDIERFNPSLPHYLKGRKLNVGD